MGAFSICHSPRILKCSPEGEGVIPIPQGDINDEYEWYVFEGEFDPEKGYRFLGLMEKDGTELKHFYLTELLKLIEMGFPVQLDTSLFNVPYCEVQSQ